MPSVAKERLVEVHPERVGAVSSPPEGPAFSVESFRDGLTVQPTRLSEERIEFDLIGVDASIANAIRRVLMAEVPTVAIEHIYIWNNTSIIQDEVLAHRLGLVPIRIDPDRIVFKEAGDGATEENTLVFTLHATCERNKAAAKTETDEEVKYVNANVYSSAITWDPKGDQESMFGTDPPRPVNPDILLAKLRPGQELRMELHCEKGLGKDHAKFSPVATASYRLLPHIDIAAGGIPREHQRKFVECFPPGVIGVRRRQGASGDDGDEVYVKNPRKDTVSREVLRHKEFEGKVTLGRIRDHFLFEIDSAGPYPPERLVPAAIGVLTKKIQTVLSGLDALEEELGVSSV
ncbi:unnamed protein product [Parajaminaea phylloscopi]